MHAGDEGGRTAAAARKVRFRRAIVSIIPAICSGRCEEKNHAGNIGTRGTEE